MTTQSFLLPTASSRGWRPNIPGTLFAIGLILLWLLAATVGPLSGMDSLQSPVETVIGAVELAQRGVLWTAITHTLIVTLVSAAIGISVGLILGLLLGLVAPFRFFSGSTLNVLRTIPMVALMPVALLVIGPEIRAELVVASIAATWPMMVNASGGVSSVHRRLSEVGRMMQFNPATIAGKLIIPAAAPQLLVGARLAIVSALVASIVTEMLIVPLGLGHLLISTQNSLQFDQMWASAAICGVIGVLLNTVLIAGTERAYGGGR